MKTSGNKPWRRTSAASLVRPAVVRALCFPALVAALAIMPVLAQRGAVPLQNAPGPSPHRTALVIGNSAYRDAPLMNPVNDASDLAEVLRALDFEVQLLLDAPRKAMLNRIREFGHRLKERGGAGLFFFAGHGMQVNGENYLIPVGADIQAEHEVEFEGMNLARVLAEMRRAQNALNIVILDACRNNPYARGFRNGSRGLASIDAPQGTLIAYATAPGSVAADGSGRNSPFTGELLRQLARPGLKIEAVFKQVRAGVLEATGRAQIPWESSSLVGDFYFLPPEPLFQLRTNPHPNLPNGAVEALMQQFDFFCADHPRARGYSHPAGRGFPNRFIPQQDSLLIFDAASRLLWQRSGSSASMQFDDAVAFVRRLNAEKFSGYDDWRLPTMEEALTLVEPQSRADGLHIDPQFDGAQRYIWTADQFADDVWVIFFALGICKRVAYDNDAQVRAVRSVK